MQKRTSNDRMVKVWRPHYQGSKEVINMGKNELKHSAHSTWRCEYHIVFAPKFRRKVIYGELRADIGQILRKLCEEKKSRNNRSRNMSGSYPYASKYSAAFECITIYGISQGKKYIDDIRSTCKSQI